MTALRLLAALSGLINTGRLLLCGGIVTLFLVFGMSYSYADEVPSSSEQVQVQPVTPEQAVTAAQETLTATSTELTTVVIPSSEAVSSEPKVQEAISTASVAITEAEVAIEDVNDAIAVVEDKEAIVVVAQTTLTAEQQELTDIQNAPLGSMNYTTDGYVAPVAPETPTVTTTTLPAMWDAATKIETPFDIKMGDTVFEGQGSASQIYVSSKATISFGGPDWTWWDWPNQTQDGIYIFQSDYMSAGTGASVVVTTTETTLGIDWTLHRFGDNNGPLTYISWDMTVNPSTGEWTGTGTIDGNLNVYGGPRTGVRQDGVLEQQTVYTSSNKQQAINTQQGIVTVAQNTLVTAQTNLTNAESALDAAIVVMDSKVELAVAAVESAKTVIEEARAIPAPAPSYSNITFDPVTPDAPTEPETPTETDTEEPSEPTEDQPQQEDSEQTDEATEDQTSEEEQTSGEEEQQESDNQEQESQSEEPSSEPTTPEEAVDEAVEEALADGELTSEEKEVIADALIEAADGEAVTAEAIAEAGLEYSDLPPSTPVEVRQDENGNQVIITADVAAALLLLENPAELVGAIFSDPGEALQALGSIGADMSPQEREEAEKMVVAAIIASGAALNAVGIATGGSAPTGGGSSGGGAPSGDSKGVRRRKP